MLWQTLKGERQKRWKESVCKRPNPVFIAIPATLWFEKSVSSFLKNNCLPDTPCSALSFWFHIPIFIYHLTPFFPMYNLSITYGTTCWDSAAPHPIETQTQKVWLVQLKWYFVDFRLLCSKLWQPNSCWRGWSDGHDLVEFQRKMYPTFVRCFFFYSAAKSHNLLDQGSLREVLGFCGVF